MRRNSVDVLTPQTRDLASLAAVQRLNAKWVYCDEILRVCAGYPMLARLQTTPESLKSGIERLARADALPTRSGPEGSSRSIFRLGRCPVSHLPKISLDQFESSRR